MCFMELHNGRALESSISDLNETYCSKDWEYWSWLNHRHIYMHAHSFVFPHPLSSTNTTNNSMRHPLTPLSTGVAVTLMCLCACLSLGPRCSTFCIMQCASRDLGAILQQTAHFASMTHLKYREQC